MGALDKVVAAIRNRIQLTGDLGSALAKRARGCPGWDNQIAKLQAELFGAQSSPDGVHGNPQKPFVPYSSGPEGSFDFNRDREDRKRIQQGGLNSVLVQKIPVTTTGLVADYNPFYCDHNGLQILARTMDDNGNITESSDTARVFIRVNNPNSPWLPLGFSFAAQGVVKSDNLVYQGYIEKFWLYVSIPTQDTVNQPNLVIALLRSVALFGPGGGSNLYASPNAGPTVPTEASIGNNPGQGGGGGVGAPQGGGGGAGGDPHGGGGGGGRQQTR